MLFGSSTATVGLLFSGGLDSSILLAHVLGQGYRVQPFYIQSHLAWQLAAHLFQLQKAGGYLLNFDMQQIIDGRLSCFLCRNFRDSCEFLSGCPGAEIVGPGNSTDEQQRVWQGDAF